MKTPAAKIIQFTLALFFMYSLVYGQPADEKTGTCGKEQALIHYTDENDYRLGCEGVAHAKNFFAEYGFATNTPINIFFRSQVTEKLSIKTENQEQIYAYYNSQNNSAYISSIASKFVSGNQRAFFGITVQQDSPLPSYDRRQMLEEMHRSTVAHEVAHLIAHFNFRLATSSEECMSCNLGHGVQEYVAAVVQFDLLEENLRRHLLLQYDPKIIFDNEDQINSVLYSCDPEGFAVMSFRHFQSLQPPQQKTLMNRIFTTELNPEVMLSNEL